MKEITQNGHSKQVCPLLYPPKWCLSDHSWSFNGTRWFRDEPGCNFP